MTTTSTLREAAQQALEALEAMLRRDERNTCQHETTHRGGAIWTICDDCGMKWADDRGGKPRWKDPQEWGVAGAAVTALRAALAEQAAEQARPDIIERLTYHALERDDLTLDDCLAYLAEGWKRVRGRTERQMVLQLTALLAGAPAAEQASPLTDERIVACVQSIPLPRPMGLVRDVGPYEVTEPTQYLRLLVRSIEQAIGSPPAPARQEPLACGHHASLAVVSAESGETLYCELCDDKAGRRDAELREQELQAELAALRTAPPAPARQDPLADWSVFNTGAEVAGGLTYAEALEYLTPPRLERGWSAVCVVNKDNITAAPAEGGANG